MSRVTEVASTQLEADRDELMVWTAESGTICRHESKRRRRSGSSRTVNCASLGRRGLEKTARWT